MVLGFLALFSGGRKELESIRASCRERVRRGKRHPQFLHGPTLLRCHHHLVCYGCSGLLTLFSGVPQCLGSLTMGLDVLPPSLGHRAGMSVLEPLGFRCLVRIPEAALTFVCGGGGWEGRAQAPFNEGKAGDPEFSQPEQPQDSSMWEPRPLWSCWYRCGQKPASSSQGSGLSSPGTASCLGPWRAACQLGSTGLC